MQLVADTHKPRSATEKTIDIDRRNGGQKSDYHGLKVYREDDTLELRSSCLRKPAPSDTRYKILKSDLITIFSQLQHLPLPAISIIVAHADATSRAHHLRYAHLIWFQSSVIESARYTSAYHFAFISGLSRSSRNSSTSSSFMTQAPLAIFGA